MNGRVARLSLTAVRLAARGVSGDAGRLAHWLYRFGTVPHGPAIDRDFGPDDDPMAVLGLTTGGAARRLLETAYDATTLPGWYAFARMHSPAQVAAACKLYVSPRPEALADAFPLIAAALVAAGVRSFKVGRGSDGLLRPDKVMVYFDGRDELDAVACRLERVLRGCPAQPVPFTAELAGDGLLSWGVDPPPGHAVMSWRAWITGKLAERLVAHHELPLAERVEATLGDMRRAGVDPEWWQVSPGAFDAERAA